MKLIKFAYKIKYLLNDNKWHTHSTKWYESADEAYLEVEEFANKTPYLEMSIGIMHKKVDL